MTTQENLPAHSPRPKLIAAWVGVPFASLFLWALFTFVITDRALFLEYLRVLAWPALAAMVLFWLREPLRDKLRQLLKFEVGGSSASFASPGDQLAHELKTDVNNLLGEGEGDPENLQADAPSSDIPHDPAGDTGGEEVQQTEPAEGDGTSEVVHVEATPVAPADTPDPSEAPEARSGAPSPRLSISPYRLVELAKAVGLGMSTTVRLVDVAQTDPDAALLLIEARARNAMAHRSPQQSRDSIESIIRKSAAWGYSMGAAGAAEVEPEVEWNSDGSWRITTEAPTKKQQGAMSRAFQATAGHARHIKDLEDEIKKMERERLSPLNLARGFESEPWLRELKSRLRLMDPSNPWA